MTDLTGKEHPPSLLYFAIFNPSFGPTEDTAVDQICFFHPPTIPLDEKTRQVGLAQALVNFTKTFSPTTPCEAVHTRKHRVILHEAEPGYWMLLKVRLGTRTRIRDGKRIMEYLEQGVQDSILRNVLLRSWEFFKLFHKGFSHVVQSQSVAALKKTLDEFFSAYVPRMDVSSLDMVDALNGIHFASLSKSSYIQIASFMHTLESTFPILRYSVFLWHDQFVWSGLDSFQDLQIIYDFVTDPETGRVYDGVVNQVKRKGEPVISTRRMGLRGGKHGKSSSTLFKSARRPSKYSGYLVGPVNLGSIAVELKKVYVGREGREHYLVIYQFEEECTLVFLIPTSASEVAEIRTGEFYARLAAFLDERLRALALVLAEGWASARNLGEYADQNFRYLYYNSMNLAFKTCIGAHKTTTLTAELIQCLNAMHDDFVSAAPNNPVNELCIKTASDAWVVGRRSDDRELYLVFPKSDLGLVDVDEEVKRFTMAHFSDILQ